MPGGRATVIPGVVPSDRYPEAQYHSSWKLYLVWRIAAVAYFAP